MKLKELPNTAVLCKTREEYDRLMKIYEDAGWLWFGGEKPTEFDGFRDVDEFVDVNDRFMTGKMAYDRDVLSLTEFLREAGVSVTKTEIRSFIKKYTVFQHDDVPFALWERDGTVQIRQGRRKAKSFTVTGDLDQWVSAFFDGYLSAPTK